MSMRMRGWCVVVALALVSAEPPPKQDARTPPADRHGDPLPEGALLRIGSVRYRAGYPTDAALSPDGKTFATTSNEEITLWAVDSGRPLHRLRSAELPPDCSPNQKFLCFSPDGKRLVSLGGWERTGFIRPGVPMADSSVRVWDVASGAEVGRFDLLGGTKQEHYLPGRYVWFTPGGKELGVLLHSGVVRFLDPSTGKETRRWDVGCPLRVECPGVALSPDGKLLAVIDSRDEQSLLLFDAATGREVRRVKATAVLGNVAFSPDSSALVVVTGGSTVRLLDPSTGRELKSFTAPVQLDENLHTGLTALTFSPDGKTLYAGSQARQILRWRLPGGETLPAMPPQAAPAAQPFAPATWVTGLFPLPDGRSVLSVSWGSGLLRRWDTATGQEIPPADGFTGAVTARLSPDGQLIAVGDSAGKLALYDMATGRQSRLLRASGPAVTTLRWSPDGTTLAAGQGGEAVSLWDTGSGREVRVLRLPEAVGGAVVVDSLAFGPDGRHLLVSRGGLWMWDVTAGKELWGGTGLSKGTLSPDGKTVAARKSPNDLVLVDADSGAVRATRPIVPRGRGGVMFMGEITFSPDGARLATAHYDGTVRLHHPKTGDEIAHFQCPKNAAGQGLAFSPDGKWLLTGGPDKVIRLWEVPSGKELAYRIGHEGPAAVAFGPDASTAVSSSPLDSTVLVWDMRPRGGPAGTPPAALWADLASDDGAKVYRAVRALAGDPKSAVPLLREKLPVQKVDDKRVRQLVKELDADAFADREKAASELSALGPSAVPLLKTLQGDNAPAEVRRRLQEIVEGLARTEAEDFRLTRAVQVLELAATAEARQLLRGWSAGASSVSLADDARAALGRLEQADKLRRAAGKP
jgi:WD40 repeat protein